MIICPFSKTSMSFDWDNCSLLLPSRDNQVCWHAETNYGHPPLFEDFNVFRPRLLQSPFAFQRQSNSLACRGKLWSSAPFQRRQCLPSLYALKRWQCFHFHLKDGNVFNHCMLSKGHNAFIYISKTTMSSVITCFQKATMLSFTFRRQQCRQSLHAFKRRQYFHLLFEDNNVFSHCMLSKDNNAFIYISNTTMSSVIACFQKVTMSSFTFRRRQCLQSLDAFKKWQCRHLRFQCLHLKDFNVFCPCAS